MGTFYVAWYTFRDTVRQPSYWLVTSVFAVLLMLSPVLFAFHFGTGVSREIVQMGASTMTLAGLLIAILASARSVYEEIDNRTALTLLAKPLDRERYLVGKYLGVYLAIAAATTILAGVCLETGAVERANSGRFEEVLSGEAALRAVAQGAILSLGESAVVTAIAVGVGVWFPLEVSGVGVLAVFLAGHTTGRIRGFLTEEGWTWLGKAIYYLIPNLENFSIDRAIGTGSTISSTYVCWASVYGIAVTAFILCVALCLFRGRELA